MSPGRDALILMSVAGLFLVLAIIALVTGTLEEKKYYSGMMIRYDLREYLSHWPARPEAGALKIGGWILLALGVVLAAVGIYFWLT